MNRMKKMVLVMITLLLLTLTACGENPYETALNDIEARDYASAYTEMQKIANEDEKESVQLLLNCIFIESVGDGCVVLGELPSRANEILYNPAAYNEDDETEQMNERLDELLQLQKEINAEVLSEDLRETYDDYFDICANVKICLNDMYALSFSGKEIDERHKEQVRGIATDLNELAISLTRIEQKYDKADLPEEILERFDLD